VLVNVVGRRLEGLGVVPQPDRYEAAHLTIDAAVNAALPFVRIKLAARNLNDQPYRVLDGGNESRRWRSGRSYTLGVTYAR
jgi:hypothetical protein